MGTCFRQLTCGLLVTFAGSLSTQAANPVLGQLEPQGAQRGTKVEVAFIGQRLGDGPHQVLFYETGIEAGSVETVDGNRTKCVLHLAEDCPLGRHALRLRTASGISNLVTFHVSNLKEIKEVEPNNSPAEPQEIATNVVVNGVVLNGDVDVFAVEVAADERLSVEIEGLRLGRTMFDPVIELQDEAGVMLASSDDQPATHQDAFVSIRAQKAGKIFVRVREAAYRGGNSATYRLHVGRFPRPTAVFPLAAVRGNPQELQWLGDAINEPTQVVEIPQTDQTIYNVSAKGEQGISPSGLPVYLSAASPLLEAEPNNNVKEANTLTAPGIACGAISAAKDKDFYRFTMKKGQEFEFRVRARELRSPLDAVLHFFDSNGKYLKGNDDDAGRPDSYLRFKAPADGEFVVDVEDRLLRGRKEMGYVLEITQPTPVAEMQLDERRRYQAQVINIPQGGRTAAMMTVRRKDFGGPLQVEWSDLPTGAKAEAVPLAGNYNRVPVLFTAEPQAEFHAKLATITAKRTDKPQPITSRFRQQTWLVRGRNNVPVWSHFSEQAAVAVTKPLPYSIRAVEPKAPLVRGGSMDLKIIANRDDGFENAIAVRTIYNPPGVSTNQSRSIRKKENEASIPITANGNARLGVWKMAYLGKTSINGEVEASTQLVTLRIVEPYFDIKIPTITALQGSTAELTITLNHRTPFDGEAELELVRLPHGVSAEKKKVQADSNSVVFQLTIAKDARVGRHRGVGCRVRMTIEGETVRYGQGYVELHVDPASRAAKDKTAVRQTTSQGNAS